MTTQRKSTDSQSKIKLKAHLRICKIPALLLSYFKLTCLSLKQPITFRLDYPGLKWFEYREVTQNSKYRLREEYK